MQRNEVKCACNANFTKNKRKNRPHRTFKELQTIHYKARNVIMGSSVDILLRRYADTIRSADFTFSRSVGRSYMFASHA